MAMALETPQMPMDETPNSTDLTGQERVELGEARVGCRAAARAYAMSELESLRYADVSDQKRRWNEVCQGLQPDVSREYDGLRAPDGHHSKRQSKKQQQQQKAKTEEDSSAQNVTEAPMELYNGVCMHIEGLRADGLLQHGFSYSEPENKREAQRNAVSEIDRICQRLDKVRCYSRSELEALRYVNATEQVSWWREVVSKLSSEVIEEFDGLWVPSSLKQQSPPDNAVWRQIAGDDLASKATIDLDMQNVGQNTFDGRANAADIEDAADERESSIGEYDSSSDEYGGIQRPAFFVEGEPDFESGPPLDGLEFLRRVRWEAAQIPKVKVVKVDSGRVTSEQTAYMPSIPEIPKCPENLLPSKDWENAFLADFSELRQGISQLESSSDDLHLIKLGKGPVRQPDCFQQLKKSPPTLTAVLSMDTVSRAAALRNSISLLDGTCILSRDNCLWLFALCAAVDAPLHGDTCASLRSLLRKCCSLLALKSEPDEEVAMLSILIAIAGKYFGQFENL